MTQPGERTFEVELSVSRARNDSGVTIFKRRVLLKDSVSDQLAKELLPPDSTIRISPQIPASNDSERHQIDDGNGCQSKISDPGVKTPSNIDHLPAPLDNEALFSSEIGFTSMPGSPKAGDKDTTGNTNLSTHEEKASDGHLQASNQQSDHRPMHHPRLKSDFVHQMSFGVGVDPARTSFLSKKTLREEESKSIQTKRDAGDGGTDIGCAGKLEKACLLI